MTGYGIVAGNTCLLRAELPSSGGDVTSWPSNSAILPFRRRERLRASPAQIENKIEHSVVGSGYMMPEAAVFDEKHGVGRFPACYAWQMLHHRNTRWEWQYQRSQLGVSAADALACLISSAVTTGSRQRTPIAAVVPNSLDMFAQQQLISALKFRNLAPKLIWRPVAAALYWQSQLGHSHPEVTSMIREGDTRILTLHLGIDGLEADFIDFVESPHHTTGKIYPARSRPCIPNQVEWAAERIESKASHECDMAQAWLDLWGSDQNNEGDHLANLDCESISPLTVWRRSRGATGVPEDGQDERLCTDSLQDWQGRITDQYNKQSRRIIGAVLTGELAGEEILADSIQSILQPITQAEPNAFVILPDSDAPNELLAAGAASYLEQDLKGEIAYLDTLPDIQTITTREGKTLWEPLVSDFNRYVIGGKQNTLHVPHKYRISSGHPELVLSVWQEGTTTVREVKQPVPGNREGDIPVRLKVTIAAGQGNPRLEVLPEQDAARFSRRVELDWESAEDTGKTREERLAEEPRSYPPLDPRVSSIFEWAGGNYGGYQYGSIDQYFTAAISELNSAVIQRPPIEELKKRLQHADDAMKAAHPPTHATAVGSSGQPHEDARQPDLAEEFVKSAVVPLSSQTIADSVKFEILRCLGYMSADNQILNDFIERHIPQLQQMNNQVRQPFLVAYGQCLRDPNTIAEFFIEATRFTTGRTTGINDWLKAICQLLRYRDDATMAISSHTCQKLLLTAYRAAKAQIDEHHAARFIYRYATLTIGYLLRRRIYDADFLHPESNHAIEIKAFLEDTAAGFTDGTIQPHGGVVDPAHVSHLIVDYIDRKGTGRLVVVE